MQGSPCLEQSRWYRGIRIKKQDAAWSRFLDLLEYKRTLYGTHIIRVDARGTTNECSECGVATSKPLWVRKYSCSVCGHTKDRDLNAAKNILPRGMTQIGAGRSESTPVQTVLPTFTSFQVDAKHVVEAGSPWLDREECSLEFGNDFDAVCLVFCHCGESIGYV